MLYETANSTGMTNGMKMLSGMDVETPLFREALLRSAGRVGRLSEHHCTIREEPTEAADYDNWSLKSLENPGNSKLLAVPGSPRFN